jgi:hypothetical protein
MVTFALLTRYHDASFSGSLSLHCACQRNVKLDAKTKEKVILALINAYPGALVEQGGVGRRTPLHIIFTGESLCELDVKRNGKIPSLLSKYRIHSRLHLPKLDEGHD